MQRLPLFLLYIIGVTLIVLAMAFRSIVIAATAAITTILSAFVGFGVLTLVVQESQTRSLRTSTMACLPSPPSGRSPTTGAPRHLGVKQPGLERRIGGAAERSCSSRRSRTWRRLRAPGSGWCEPRRNGRAPRGIDGNVR